MENLEILCIKALETAVKASDEIMRIYQTSFSKQFKTDGSPVTEADTASAKIIEKLLKETNIPIICEEDDKSSYKNRELWKEVWIVDPLDGTKEFIRKNGEFAINIALVRNHQPIFGLIASPVERFILFGGREMGVFQCHFEDVNVAEKWLKVSPSSINSPIIMASSRTPYREKELNFIQMLEEIDDVDFLKKGSALKFIDMALGKADIYPRFAPTMEWDIAAGQAILEALGGVVIDASTKLPLIYNKESLFNPHFVAKTRGFVEVESALTYI